MRAHPAILLAALACTAPVRGAERTVAVGSFARVRVAGPFAVRIVIGSPGVRIEGDGTALDAVDVGVESETLHVRAAAGGWGETPARRPAALPAITLSTPALRSVAVGAGSQVVADRVSGSRVDLAVNGAGTLEVGSADAEDLSATVIGAGKITLAGRALRARLLTNGPGVIDAAELEASDLAVRLDGTGETRAQARYTARITDTGAGRVNVSGEATCVVSAVVASAVTCGHGR